MSRRPRASGYFRTGYAQDLKLVETRVTNTNEVGRTSVLHPGFSMLEGEALHLVEIALHQVQSVDARLELV